MASIFRAFGLTFKDVGFVKLNIFFPAMLGVSHLTVTAFCSSGLSAAAVAALPVPAEKVPFFVAAVLPIIAVLCAIVALQTIAAIGTNGYQNQSGREQKYVELPGWISRVRSAQNNTWEACICMGCCFYVAGGLDLPKPLFAKLATLFLGCRVAYPLFFGLDLDLLRTQCWLIGLYTLLMTAFAALFPDVVLPMLGA